MSHVLKRLKYWVSLLSRWKIEKKMEQSGRNRQLLKWIVRFIPLLVKLNGKLCSLHGRRKEYGQNLSRNIAEPECFSYFTDSRLAYELSPKLLSSKETTDNGTIRSRDHFKLKTRRQHIARLRKDLRAACSVVKTLELRKKREVNLLKGLLSYARNECVDLLQRYNGAINKSLCLHNQNQILNENLENLNSVIQLEYEKLLEISSVVKEDYEPSTLGKLKKVLECCEQFHEENGNESEKSAKVQQSNRFLKNRIFILELNIGALKQQLKNLEYQNTRLKSEKDHLRSVIKLGPTDNTVCYEAEALFDKNIRKEKSGDSPQNKELDLTTHMRIVKRLLSDQNVLMKDLDKITNELSLI